MLFRSYIGHHICPSVGVNKDGRMMDSNFLAQELHKYVLKDHTCKIKDLQNLMKERLQHKISYYKIWDAKQKAIANIHGNWEESYQKLQKLLLAYKDNDLGTQVSYRSINGYQVLLYSSMCSGLSLIPLLDSHIVGQ